MSERPMGVECKKHGFWLGLEPCPECAKSRAAPAPVIAEPPDDAPADTLGPPNWAERATPDFGFPGQGGLVIQPAAARPETTAGELSKSNQRMWDLLRYCRMELHSQELITDDEYTELAKDHAAVQRLEDYDVAAARASSGTRNKVLEEAQDWLVIVENCLQGKHRYAKNKRILLECHQRVADLRALAAATPAVTGAAEHEAECQSRFCDCRLAGLVPSRRVGVLHKGFTFEEWFNDWDMTKDIEIRRLCKIAWVASRAAVPADEGLREALEKHQPRIHGIYPNAVLKCACGWDKWNEQGWIAHMRAALALREGRT